MARNKKSDDVFTTDEEIIKDEELTTDEEVLSESEDHEKGGVGRRDSKTFEEDEDLDLMEEDEDEVI